MITPTTASEKLLFITIRIETNLGTGTGFLFNFSFDDQIVPVIITNKHVVLGSSTGQFHLHEAETVADAKVPSGTFFLVDLDQFEERWIFHPDDEIDICAMLFEPLLEKAKSEGKTIFFSYLLESNILSDTELERECSAVEDVLMVGYPTGLWDYKNNLPIIRRGITATHAAIDFCGKSVSVVDAACFPGSSGSPVVLVNEGAFSPKEGGLSLGIRVVLLGVLFEGPCWTAEGEIVIRKIPTNKTPIPITQIMIHLGYIVKSKEILVLGDYIKRTLMAPGGPLTPSY